MSRQVLTEVCTLSLDPKIKEVSFAEYSENIDVEIPGLVISYVVKQTNHLIFDVYVIIQVSQASLLESRGYFLYVTAQVFEQLRVAITAPEAYLALAGQMDGVEDFLVSETWKGQLSVQLHIYSITAVKNMIASSGCFVSLFFES